MNLCVKFILLALIVWLVGCEVDTKYKLSNGGVLTDISFELSQGVTRYHPFSMTLSPEQVKSLQKDLIEAPAYFDCSTPHAGTSSLDWIASFSDGTVTRKSVILKIFKDAVFAQFETSSDEGFHGMNSATVRLDETIGSNDISKICEHFSIDRSSLKNWPGNGEFPKSKKGANEGSDQKRGQEPKTKLTQ